MTTEALAIVAVEAMTAVQLFTPGSIEPLLERIKSEARASAAQLDISTPKGRKDIASLAYKVARTKTFIDEQGKRLTEKQKAEIAVIDAERKKTREQLDALRDEVRQPLDEWEEAEKTRVANLEARVQRLTDAHNFAYSPTTEEIEQRIQMVTAEPTDLQEFTKRAECAKQETLSILNAQLVASKHADAERAELARLRKEEADRKQREHEAQIAAEAKRKADEAAAAREAEIKRQAKEAAAEIQRKAEAERQRVEREAREREEAERVAKEKAIRAKEEAEAAAAKAEQDRIAAIKKAEDDAAALARKVEADRIEAARVAEEQQKAAIEAERKRVEAAKRAEEEKEAKREANKRHCAKINREVLDALMYHAEVSEEVGKSVIRAIASGIVPNCKISY